MLPVRSELNRLDRVDDSGLRVPHHVSALTVPHLTHLGQEPFSIFESVELQVDQNIVRIVNRSQHLISTNARPFAIDRIVVEGLLPAAEAGDCMFDPQDWHRWLLS